MFLAATGPLGPIVDRQLKERIEMTPSHIGAAAAGLALQQAGVIAADADVICALDGRSTTARRDGIRAAEGAPGLACRMASA